MGSCKCGRRVGQPIWIHRQSRTGFTLPWYAHLFLLLWLAAVLVTIARAILWRKKLGRRALELERDSQLNAAVVADARALDRALNFLDRSVFLSLLFGVLATLVLVRRTLQKIGARGQVEFATVAGPWSEAMGPLLFALWLTPTCTPRSRICLRLGSLSGTALNIRSA